jgi:uncharacterized membrane-anchored protein
MKMNKHLLKTIVFFVFSICVLMAGQNTCRAQGEEKEENVYDKVQWQGGPSDADIDKWAKIHVPAGYVFANAADTRMLMEAMGNIVSNEEVGFFAPDNLAWFVLFEFDAVGFIKDDDKDSLDADAILDSIRRGTEEGNKIRREKGFSGLTIVGWEVDPSYNENTHNLEWAIRAQDDNGEFIVNHNTRILGRKGVMRLTLVVDPQELSAVLPLYRTSMNNFSFQSGQKYAEFIKGDKIAQYGLTALVAGGAGAAAAKLGLFKIIGKFGKAIVVAIIAFFAALWSRIKRLFARKKESEIRTINEETRFAEPPEDETDKSKD